MRCPLPRWHASSSMRFTRKPRSRRPSGSGGRSRSLIYRKKPKGLGVVNRELVRELGRRCPEQRIATVDRDATIIESRKQEALRTYEGERGYPPMLAVWAERNVALADEFRDGNVPAMMAPLTVAKQAYAALDSMASGEGGDGGGGAR